MWCGYRNGTIRLRRLFAQHSRVAAVDCTWILFIALGYVQINSDDMMITHGKVQFWFSFCFNSIVTSEIRNAPSHKFSCETKEKLVDDPIRNYTKTFGESTLRNNHGHDVRTDSIGNWFKLQITAFLAVRTTYSDVLGLAIVSFSIRTFPLCFLVVVFFRFLVRKKNQLAHHHHHFDEFAQNAIVSLVKWMAQHDFRFNFGHTHRSDWIRSVTACTSYVVHVVRKLTYFEMVNIERQTRI